MILESIRQEKRYFNIKNKKDINLFKEFLVNNGWGRSTCPFIVEHPFISAPDMIKDKLIKHFLKV